MDYNIVEGKEVRLASDRFDSTLLYINNLNKLEAFIDSSANANSIAPGTLDFVIEAKEIIAKRFYHKYATHNLNENWIASVTQKVTGLYLSSKITADDILTKPYGYCGQQSAVFMEYLQRKNIPARAVYLPHHFAMQVKLDSVWYFFDVDGEPDLSIEQRADLSWTKNRDTLTKVYKKDEQWIDATFGKLETITYGKIHEVQGPNAQIFQKFTKEFSKIAFLFPLFGFVYFNRKKPTLDNSQAL